MVRIHDLRKIAAYLYEIPPSFRPDMRVPARFYADEALIENVLADRCLEQLVNTATLPGVVNHVLAMPDMHQGYGFPIGGVVATALPDGVISPGGVGYDINCGVRLLASRMSAEEIRPHLDALASALVLFLLGLLIGDAVEKHFEFGEGIGRQRFGIYLQIGGLFAGDRVTGFPAVHLKEKHGAVRDERAMPAKPIEPATTRYRLLVSGSDLRTLGNEP